MNTELETLKQENQSYKENLPRFQMMAEQLNSEILKANTELQELKIKFKKANSENVFLNKCNILCIALSGGVIGATVIFIATHTIR